MVSISTEVVIALISGVFAAASALFSGYMAYAKQRVESKHRKEVERLKLEKQNALEKQRLNFEKEDSNYKRFIDQQSTMSNSYDMQIKNAMQQNAQLREELKMFKEQARQEGKELRESLREYKNVLDEERRKREEISESLNSQIHEFKNILRAMKYNMKLMGSGIKDVYNELNEDKDVVLKSKVDNLNDIHSSIVNSLNSTDVRNGFENDVTVRFEKPDREEVIDAEFTD